MADSAIKSPWNGGMDALMSAHDELPSHLSKARGGDRRAFEAAVACCRSRLESVIDHLLGESIRQQAGVDDVLQETFMRAFRALGEFQWRGEQSFFRWLTSISRHVVLELAEKQKQGRTVPLHENIQHGDLTPSRVIRRRERFDRLQKALNKLSPEQREVVLLARVERIPIKEIANRMQRTPNAVSHLLLRALQQLRSDFGDTESFGLPEEPVHGEGLQTDG